MGRASSIKVLPPEVKETLDRLLRADRATQQSILRLINAELERRGGDPVSRSSLSRYAIRMRAAGAKITQAREVAKVWVGELGEEPAGEVGRLMIELIRTMAFDAASAAMDKETPAAPGMIGTLATAVRDLERAATLSTDRELVIRKEVARAAAKVAKLGARQAGLSAATAQQIYDQVLGVRRQAA